MKNNNESIRKFYAVQSIWGKDVKEIIKFASKKERDEFVNKTDYTDVITAKQLKEGKY